MKKPGKAGPISRSGSSRPKAGSQTSRLPNKIREPGTLKEATAELVRLCGGYEAAGKRVRVGSSTLQRYTDPAEKTTYAPADVIVALELAGGDPIVTRFLAAEQGCHLSCVKYEPSPEAFSEDMAALAKDVAQLTADAFKALARGADAGQIPEAIAGSLIADIDRTAAILFHMRGRLRKGGE